MLRHKRVTISISYPMCIGDVEHMLHIFFDCHFATNWWRAAGLEFNMAEVEFAPDWLLERLSHEPHEKLITIATVLWSIWFARNKKVWEGAILSPKTAFDLCMKQVLDWRQVWKKRMSSGRNMVYVPNTKKHEMECTISRSSEN